MLILAALVCWLPAKCIATNNTDTGGIRVFVRLAADPAKPNSTGYPITFLNLRKDTTIQIKGFIPSEKPHNNAFFGDATNAKADYKEGSNPPEGKWVSRSAGGVVIPWLGGSWETAPPLSALHVKIENDPTQKFPALLPISPDAEIWILAGSPNVACISKSEMSIQMLDGALVKNPASRETLSGASVPGSLFAIRRAENIEDLTVVLPISERIHPTFSSDLARSWHLDLISVPKNADPWRTARPYMTDQPVLAPVTGLIWWSGEFDAQNLTGGSGSYEVCFENYLRALIAKFAHDRCFKLIVIAPARRLLNLSVPRLIYEGEDHTPLQKVRLAQQQAVIKLQREGHLVAFIDPPGTGWAWEADTHAAEFSALASRLAEAADSLPIDDITSSASPGTP